MTGSGRPPGQGRADDPANRWSMDRTTGEFEAVWRELRPRIERLLRSRGAKADVVDDVTQETGIKLFGSWDRVDPDRPVWPLARTIALNCLVDQFRGRVAEPVGEVPEKADVYDLEAHGLARARLANVTTAMKTLRPKDRSLLLAEVGEDDARPSTSAYKMARMRARQRLAQALERSAAAFGGVQVGFRKIVLWTQAQGASGGESYLAALAGATVAASLAITAMTPAQPSEAGRSLPRRETRIATASGAGAGDQGGRKHVRERKEPAPTPSPDRSGAVAGGTTPASPAPATPAPPRDEQTEVAEAADTSAKTGSGKGYRYVAVCHEEGSAVDGEGTSVTYNDGQQEGDEEYEHCE